MAVWEKKETDANIDLMEEVLQWPAPLCRALANRGVRDKHGAVKYFYPKVDYMHKGHLFANMDEALDRIILAIVNEEVITVYGDYDVDGVMSTVMLVKALKYLDANITYALPHREIDGYGLTKDMVERLHLDGTNLIITVDNGIAAFEEIAFAKELNMDVIVFDHHEQQNSQLPDAIVVDAKQEKCSYPFKELCAAGLIYKAIIVLFEKINKPLPFENEFLILSAIATICDVVPLVDENRIIVACGLAHLHRNKNENIGLFALCKILGLEHTEISVGDVGYKIGPIINAAGRLSHAEFAVELFLSVHIEEAMEKAQKMYELNIKRQEITKLACEKAMEFAKDSYTNDIIKVFYLPDIHESVAGIVAGKLKEELSRPVLVLTDGVTAVKGSGRSMYPYDMFAGLENEKELLMQFGGHELAAGLMIEEENIEKFRKQLNEHNTLEAADFVEVYTYDDGIELDIVDMTFAKQIAFMSPFGVGNEKPLFVFPHVHVIETKIIGKNKDVIKLICSTNSKKLDVIAFGLLEHFQKIYINKVSIEAWEILQNEGKSNDKFMLDILGSVEINYFRHKENLQIQMIDCK